MTDRYDSYIDDWLPEDEDEYTDGSYDLDHDFTASDPLESIEQTIDDYEEKAHNNPELPDNDGLLWVWWR